MRAIVLLASMAAIALGLNIEEHHSRAKVSQHDYRSCKGTVCDAAGASTIMSSTSSGTAEATGHQQTDSTSKYPWWTGVELGKAGAPIKIEAWLSYTCPGCREHWENVWIPLVEKYGSRVSLIHQPFALPYQPFSYDATQAAFAVYRLSSNSVVAWKEWSSNMFANQMFVYNTWDMTTTDVWKRLASFAPTLSEKDIFNAMNGTITTANYDAWYQARYARQRTLPGAPTFVINGWIPADIDVGSWNFSDWSKWLDANL